jgi:hypothetical protein
VRRAEPERYFENAFLIDVHKLSLSLIYPKSMEIQPTIYYINQETEEKTKSEIQPTIQQNGDYLVANYVRNENIKGETIRLEW